MRFTKSLKHYLAHASTIIFLIGFFFDAYILPNIDDVRARYIGCIYLFLIALLIYVRELIVSRNTASETERRLFAALTFGISYFSGSALSFVFIYTMRSGALSVSWPLFLVLFLCIMANEFVSTHNFRFTLDVGILFVASLFYTIFTTPFLLKVQNDVTFLVSLGISLVISFIYIKILSHASETALHEAPRGYALSIGVPLFVGMLYFLNVIPAVPLSLHDAGVYHHIEKLSSGVFEAEQEVTTGSRFSLFQTEVYHLRPEDTGVYFYSSVDAPAELTAPLAHVWEYYDEAKHAWIESTVIPFGLAGGRDDGYRAYSYKQNINEGLWRVTVKVDNNRIIGRSRFRVIKTESVGLQPVTL